LLKKFPEMKVGDTVQLSKKHEQLIQRNLVPNVVAANKKELIDFDRKFQKEEKMRKERPLPRKVKDKVMAEIYLRKPASERSKSRKKSRTGSVHSRKKSQLSARSSHSKKAKPVPKNPISDKLSKAIQGCIGFRTGRMQKKNVSRSPTFRKRTQSVQSEQPTSIKKAIIPSQKKIKNEKKVRKLKRSQSYRKSSSVEKH
jgi:hypothetical protein